MNRWLLRSISSPRKWQPIVGVEIAEYRIKQMKTRWGTCSPSARRIWLNLELAKKPECCLEYVLVHEPVHLLEPHHDERFIARMTKIMPQWQLLKDAA
jgi:predicted metal-dependent hydrolase